MRYLTLATLDASNNFKLAFMNNLEKNGLENTISQFKALCNSFAPDFYIDVQAENIHNYTEAN